MGEWTDGLKDLEAYGHMDQRTNGLRTYSIRAYELTSLRTYQPPDLLAYRISGIGTYQLMDLPAYGLRTPFYGFTGVQFGSLYGYL